MFDPAATSIAINNEQLFRSSFVRRNFCLPESRQMRDEGTECGQGKTHLL